MAFAENTTVPVERSQAEIRKILVQYKAGGFVFGEGNNMAMIQFEMNGRRIKFTMPLPILHKTKCRTGRYAGSTVVMGQKQVDQETRRLWRCLVMSVKSKLESVASGITTFEQEFMAHIVMPNGQTVGDIAIPQIEETYRTGQMPPLLGMRPQQ